MASRFVEADEGFIQELRNTSENKNTKRSRDYWTNIFQQWTKTRGKNEQLESCEVPELNEALAQFFGVLKTENENGCLDKFALYVMNNQSQVPSGNKGLISLVFSKFSKLPLSLAWRLGQFCENFENTSEINPLLPSGPCDYIYKVKPHSPATVAAMFDFTHSAMHVRHFHFRSIFSCSFQMWRYFDVNQQNKSPLCLPT